MLKAVVGGTLQGVGRLVVLLAAVVVERQLGLCSLLYYLQQVLADPICACLLLLPAVPPDLLADSTAYIMWHCLSTPNVLEGGF